MKRTQTLVQLTEDLVHQLDSRAEALGVSRSKLIRELLERGLAEEAEAKLARRMNEGYQRVPQSEGRDAWGDLDVWVQVMSRRNMAALAEDEEHSW